MCATPSLVENTLQQAALEYVNRFKIQVVPLHPREKRPLTRNGYKDGTANSSQITGWWKHSPRANVGAVTGFRSGIVVLDIDPRNGGDDSLRKIEHRFGPLPKTPISLTGGGGLHYFFRHPGGIVRCRTGLLPGIDLKADGGLIVMPPSIHPTGRQYHWEVSGDIRDVPLAPVPQWLLTVIKQPMPLAGGPSSGSIADLVRRGAAEGSRNIAAVRVSGYLLGKNVDRDVALAFVRYWNASKNRPPLSDEEVHDAFRSIAIRESRKRGGGL